MSDELEQAEFTGICIVINKAGGAGYLVRPVNYDGTLDENSQSCLTSLPEVIGDVSKRIQDWDFERAELARRQAIDDNGNVVEFHRRSWRGILKGIAG